MDFASSCPDDLPIHRSVSYTRNPTCEYGVRRFFFSQNERTGLPYLDDLTLVSSHPMFSSPLASVGSDLSAFYRLHPRKTTSEGEKEQLNLMQTQASPPTGLGNHNYRYTGLAMEQLGLIDLVISTLTAAALTNAFIILLSGSLSQKEH